MARYKSIISKLMSNLFFRVLLCMIILMFGAMFVRFSNSMTSFGKNIDGYEINNPNAYNENNNNKASNDAMHINLSENEDSISYNNLLNKINTNQDMGIELSETQYVTASFDNSNKYPENWISEFNEKIMILQTVFPDGKYWNHMGQKASNPNETNNIYSVTDIPCNHMKNGEKYCNAHYGKSDEVYPYKATCSQCRGFASLLSDLIFGEDAPVTYFENYDELRIGDQARIDDDFHSVFIIDKTDEYVVVAECNCDLETCKIQWGRKILREDMSGWYLSRWGDSEK